MSKNVNDEIRERAGEARDESVGSMLGDQLDDAIKHDDLERMQSLTSAVERHLTYLDIIRDSEIA